MANTELVKQAMEIARAQAGVRPMTASEVATYISELVQSLQGVVEGDEVKATPSVEPKNSITETYAICLECGKKFKVIGNRHLKSHGLTVKEYKEKWGLKKGTSLAAKSLVRQRRKKMQEMQLWKRKSTFNN